MLYHTFISPTIYIFGSFDGWCLQRLFFQSTTYFVVAIHLIAKSSVKIHKHELQFTPDNCEFFFLSDTSIFQHHFANSVNIFVHPRGWPSPSTYTSILLNHLHSRTLLTTFYHDTTKQYAKQLWWKKSGQAQSSLAVPLGIPTCKECP